MICTKMSKFVIIVLYDKEVIYVKKIKKVISIVLCLSFLFNIIPLRVKADDNNIKQAVVTTSTLRFREKATTSSNIY